MIIDLTHTITPDTCVYPGTPRPAFSHTRTLTDNGCNIRYQYVGTTTGTLFNLDITTKEMLQAIRDANSTTIK